MSEVVWRWARRLRRNTTDDAAEGMPIFWMHWANFSTLSSTRSSSSSCGARRASPRFLFFLRGRMSWVVGVESEQSAALSFWLEPAEARCGAVASGTGLWPERSETSAALLCGKRRVGTGLRSEGRGEGGIARRGSYVVVLANFVSSRRCRRCAGPPVSSAEWWGAGSLTNVEKNNKRNTLWSAATRLEHKQLSLSLSHTHTLSLSLWITHRPGKTGRTLMKR